jgi:hypothetical protein
VETEGHWADLGAWCEWASANWYDQENVSLRDTLDDIGHYVLCCKLVSLADTELERLQALLRRCADEIPVSEWGDLDLYEAVRKAGGGAAPPCCCCSPPEITVEIDDVTFNCDLQRAFADAVRYRWLRRVAPEGVAAIAWRVPAACKHGADEVDACVDAAMSKVSDGKAGGE